MGPFPPNIRSFAPGEYYTTPLNYKYLVLLERR